MPPTHPPRERPSITADRKTYRVDYYNLDVGKRDYPALASDVFDELVSEIAKVVTGYREGASPSASASNNSSAMSGDITNLLPIPPVRENQLKQFTPPECNFTEGISCAFEFN